MIRKMCLPLLIVIAISLIYAQAESFFGKVIGISDGDTITVLIDKKPVKIRLYGIDAPEKGQPYGNNAKQYLSSLIFSKQVEIKPVNTDRYGRTIAWVYVGETCANEEMIKSGLAWHYKYFSSEETLAALEQEARSKEKGLWSSSNPIAPWEWRKGTRKSTKSEDTNYSSSDNESSGSGSEYHGNTQSKIFHCSSCRYYNCKNCTAVFGSREQAIKAGYRACKICRP